MEFQWPDYLPEIDGERQFAGTRLGPQDVLRLYNQGHSAEMLALQYPSLDLVTIYKFLAFYLENQTGADEYVEAYQREVDAYRTASLNRLPLADLRQRLAKRAKLGSA